MGVTGLWRLIEPAGKPVPVETLENKVLAVDISIWLHQMVKGYQDAKGAPLPNAHLMGLFQRLCKLLYFRIKPVFIFDGAYPELKKETIAKRQDSKAKYNSVSERLKRELALLSVKKTAIHSLLEKQVSPKKGTNPDTNNDDIFKLPDLPQKDESESESEEESSSSSIADLHSVDIESDKFKSLPTKEKYDLLIELKETRKMNSWGRLHELPKKSDSFSDFQLQRLLKRRKVQECLEETEKEMGDAGMSLNDLEVLLNETGINTKIEANIPTKRIAANDNTRFILINNVRQALADARKRKLAEINKVPADGKDESRVLKTEEEKPLVKEKLDEDLELAIRMSMECMNEPSTSKTVKADVEYKKNDELEDDLERAMKMSLECVEDPSTSVNVSKTDDSWTSFTDNESPYTDSEVDECFIPPDMSSAKAYITQYSDFTYQTINDIVTIKGNRSKKGKGVFVDKIIEEINKESSVIIDRVELSSDDNNVDVTDTHKDTDQSIEELELDTSTENISTENINFNDTQASVVCIDRGVPDVIEISSSLDESKEIDIVDTKKGTDSDSYDEFEEVPEIETKPKTVVQVVLKTDEISEDDIFAEVFTDKVKKSDTKNVILETVTKEENKIISTDNDQRAYVQMNKSKEIVNLNKLSNAPCLRPPPENQIKASDENLSGITAKKDLKINLNDKELEKSHNKESNDKINITMNTSKESIVEDNINTTKSNQVKENINNIENTQDNNLSANVGEVLKPPKDPITTEQLNDMVNEIQVEQDGLLQEKGRLDRVGRNITEQMTKEAQEMLRIFGIPYIVAPMEAEAQCAFLESVKLTDGTITDDSDIWLFGGRTVYKNFFNQKKHVLQFLSERIEKSFNLGREQLILLALLVGSDYTTGVSGVGPVTAMEILASFPFNKKQLIDDKNDRCFRILTGLQEFKKWVRAGKRTDNTSLKKKLRNVALADDFSNVRVVQAYLDPNVEKSEDKFTWGEPDITVLRDYTKVKFGWSQNKLDEIIKPVLKRLAERKSQKTVHDYFKRKIEFQPLDEYLSKRVKAAVQRLGPEVIEDPKKIKDQKTSNKIKNPVKRKGKKRTDNPEAGPSKTKKNEEDVLKEHGVKVVIEEGNSDISITIPKTNRYQEIIPQRERYKQKMLENKLKAIELFRKTKLDPKKKLTKRKPIIPKDKAQLSESDSD